MSTSTSSKKRRSIAQGRALLAAWQASALGHPNREATHTNEVINHLERLENEVVRLRYDAMGHSVGKGRPEDAELAIAAEEARVRHLTADNPVQQEHLDRFEPALKSFTQGMHSRSTAVASIMEDAAVDAQLPAQAVERCRHARR